MAAIAKRLGLGTAAAAKTDSRATSQAEGFTLEVENRKFAFDTERAMIRHNDFGFCQVNLPGDRVLFLQRRTPFGGLAGAL
jgi:hypothetical protein